MTGTVTKVLDRGFGFIRPEGADHQAKDIFFHCRDLRGMEFEATLVERRVEFSISSTAKGPCAIDIRPVN